MAKKDLTGSGYGVMDSFCEYDNEPLSCIQGANFLTN
jgi:hypothetical protein